MQLTVDCGKHLVRDLFGQVEGAATFAQLKARPVAVLKQEHGGIDVLGKGVVLCKAFGVQGAAHGLRDSHDDIGHVSDGIEADVGREAAGGGVLAWWTARGLEDKGRTKGEDGRGAREELEERKGVYFDV